MKKAYMDPRWRNSIDNESLEEDIVINKEYFRERFAKVLKEWDQKLWYGIGKDLRVEFLNDLMKCFDEEG
jgi:hypothetical protein